MSAKEKTDPTGTAAYWRDRHPDFNALDHTTRGHIAENAGRIYVDRHLAGGACSSADALDQAFKEWKRRGSA